MFVDPTGNLAWFAVIGIAALVGGLIYGGTDAASQYILDGNINLKQTLASTGWGAVTGGLIGVGGTVGFGIRGMMAWGAASEATGYATSNLIMGTTPTIEGYAHSMLTGLTAAGGGALNKASLGRLPNPQIGGSALMASEVNPVYSANGDPVLRSMRRPIFDTMLNEGIVVNGKKYTLNEHAYNSLFKSGRKDIMPIDISDALKVDPIPGEPGSVIHVNPVTKTTVIVNPGTSEVVGIWPSDFK